MAGIYFGFADRTEEESSDIDIMVELDYDHPMGLDFVTMWLDLKEMLGKEVDLVTTEGISPLIFNQVEAQKRLIYER